MSAQQVEQGVERAVRSRRVLLSAFACVPGRGSEPGAGWIWACAAARSAEVVLLTERENEAAIEAELARRPVPGLHPVYVDVPPLVQRLSTGDRRIRLRHAAWQRAAGRLAQDLHRQRPFDVLHHLTWSADWQPVGIARVDDVPLVWGPVGGACPLPWRMARYFSGKALAGELGRWAAGGAGRRAFGDRVARRASLVLCQNDHVVERFRSSTTGRVVVEPNVAVDPAVAGAPAPETSGSVPGSSREAVFAGRLHDWKGLRLALHALARPEAAGWHLSVLGDGPARAGAQELARRLGVADRVCFSGQVSHEQVLARLSEADALLFPSFHEGCGWVVAEALSLGCPVVCLDVGGPPVLVARAGAGVCVPVRPGVARRLATALQQLPLARPARTDVFGADRLPELLRGWYDEVQPTRVDAATRV